MSRNAFYGWLSTEPMVLLHNGGSTQIDAYLPEDRMFRLVMYAWDHQPAQIMEYERQVRAIRPRHVLHHLINDLDVCNELRAAGVAAHFINHNCLLDERLYRIQTEVERHFDAVYNARMAPFKRHALAAEIDSVLMIGGVIAPSDDKGYFEKVRRALPQAQFSHDDDNRHRSPEEVVRWLNKARVGLCLSAKEGAMFAATEYLLCGLPIVSTVSTGGRDVWFDSRFTRVVPSDAVAVANAVRELIQMRISPELIRRETLRRMWEHRRRLLDLGQEIFAATSAGRDFARDFYPRFRNKLGAWLPVEHVMRSYPLSCSLSDERFAKNRE